jgi:hypothetical protein
MGNGPKVTVERSCFDCDHVRTKHYAVQGDSGCDVACAAAGGRAIGDTTWKTPDWCPALPAPSAAPAVLTG